MKPAAERSNHTVLTVEQVRSIDRLAVDEFGMHSLVLMENAGRGIADRIRHWIPEPGRTTILCGVGNNGGDGLVVARHLGWWGWSVTVVMLGQRGKLTQDAACNLSIFEKSKGSILWVSESDLRLGVSPHEPGSLESLENAFDRCDLIVDAMLGTGSTGAPRSPMREAIELANRSDAIRLSIDQPTGLDACTGQVFDPCFLARYTCTLVASKPGLVRPQKAVVGTLEILPIGIPAILLDRFE